MQTQQSVDNSRADLNDLTSLKVVRIIAKVMDKWCLDPLLGFVPYVGDLVTPIMSLPYLYVSIFKIKSVSLTLVLIYNVLVDCAIGLIPWLGNIFDFFSKSYVENLNLLEGYIVRDPKVIRKVRRKIAFLISMIVLLIALIIGLVILIGKLAIWLGEVIYSCFV